VRIAAKSKDTAAQEARNLADRHAMQTDRQCEGGWDSACGNACERIGITSSESIQEQFAVTRSLHRPIHMDDWVYAACGAPLLLYCTRLAVAVGRSNEPWNR
jgi:hypothetical protein